MKKNIFVVLVLMSLLLFLVGCQTQTAPAAQPAPVPEVRSPPALEETTPVSAKTSTTIAIENFKFMPTDTEIKVGDTVEWVNKDTVAHTVSLDNGNVDQELPAGGSVTYTFTEKGEYGYTCRFHPSMKGKVIVN